MSIESDNKTECYRNCKALCTCKARKLLSEIQKRKALHCRRLLC